MSTPASAMMTLATFFDIPGTVISSYGAAFCRKSVNIMAADSSLPNISWRNEQQPA
jgi:hypothetical protein